MSFATRTWVTGELVTASIANAQWRDNLDLLQQRQITVGFGVFGADAITTGVQGYLPVRFAGTITGWVLISNTTAGSLVIDVWKDTYANAPPTSGDSITGTEMPTLSSGIKNQDTSLSTWVTSIAAGDILGFNVVSRTTTVSQATLTLYVNVA